MPRGPGWGFQPGHPPFYRGGSVHGHLPTSDGSHLPKTGNAERLKPFRFKKGNRPVNNGMPATAKQRECMEALQNLKEPLDAEAQAKLMQRFPPGMVRRLTQLVLASEDPEDSNFIHAQRLIREILIAPKRHQETGEEATAATGPTATVHVIHGRVDAPMPGAPGAPLPPEVRPAGAGSERAADP